MTDKLEADDPDESPGNLTVTGRGLDNNYPNDAKVQPVAYD